MLVKGHDAKTRLISIFRSMLLQISILCNYGAVKGGKCVSISLNRRLTEWLDKL